MMILIEYIIARPILEIEFFEKKSKISFLLSGRKEFLVRFRINRKCAY